MQTANEKLLDESIAHAVLAESYSNSVINRMMKLLNRVDADLMLQIQVALDKLPPERFNVERLTVVLKAVRQLNGKAYADISEELNNELASFTEYELDYQKQLMVSVLPAIVPVATVTPDRVYAAAMSRPFQGKLLSEWMQSLEESRAIKIRDAIRIGYVESQTLQQIMARIRGTKAKSYADGLLNISRRDVETITRTALSHTAAFSRMAHYEANAEIIKAIQWVSTLDGKTSDICRPRDGKIYDAVTHKPIGHSFSWHGGAGQAHFRCRSRDIAVLKSWKELGIPIEELTGRQRSSMDGYVPRELKYGEWLKGKGVEFQDDVLGKAKGKLLRDGGLGVDDLYKNNGKAYTLAELRTKESSAFKKAGLK